MKIILASLLLFCIFDYELPALRQAYIEAATSEIAAQGLHKKLQGIDDSHSGTLVAYKAASIVLLAKYEGSIIKKTRLFNRGTELLESAIKQSPDNYEARLIRLNIQDNVPWITGYTSEIKKDKAFLLQHYRKQPGALRSFAKNYILQSDAFSEAEKKSLD